MIADSVFNWLYAEKFNPNHDESGKFSSGDGGGGDKITEFKAGAAEMAKANAENSKAKAESSEKNGDKDGAVYWRGHAQGYEFAQKKIEAAKNLEEAKTELNKLYKNANETAVKYKEEGNDKRAMAWVAARAAIKDTKDKLHTWRQHDLSS